MILKISKDNKAITDEQGNIIATLNSQGEHKLEEEVSLDGLTQIEELIKLNWFKIVDSPNVGTL